MSTELHEFPAEEVMAYLDGEVTGERALALADHLQQCAECASLADDFCALSQQLVAWKVEPSLLKQPSLPVAVEAGAWCSEAATDPTLNAEDPRSSSSEPPAAHPAPRSSLLHSFAWRPFIQRPWILGLGSAFAALLIVSFVSFRLGRVAPKLTPRNVYEKEVQDAIARMAIEAENTRRGGSPKEVSAGDANLYERSERGAPLEEFQRLQAQAKRNNQTGQKMTGLEQSVHSELATKVTALDTDVHSELATKVDTAVVPVQMIERTASLSLTVKEMDAARAALEDIAKRHYGYFAELNTEGQSDAGRTLTASLRVPAGELDATLGELRNLGHLDEEKQGGEEVSQQHIDLEARLQNARNTEKRLTNLLIKRTDKLKDVLDVERELASTREEIERMEAQLRNMENQVSYASIDLKLREEYKPVLNLAPPATGARLRNALVNGYHSAVESALGLVLFLFQEGPSILFWLLLLFFPARWTWRKLRAFAAQKQPLAGTL